MRKCEQLPNASQEPKLEIFTAGLPRYIRWYLKLNKPETIEDALEKAKSSEEAGPDPDDGSQDIREMQKSIEHLIDKFSTKNPGVSAFQEPKCYRCQKMGHFANKCTMGAQNNEATDRNVLCLLVSWTSFSIRIHPVHRHGVTARNIYSCQKNISFSGLDTVVYKNILS